MLSLCSSAPLKAHHEIYTLKEIANFLPTNKSTLVVFDIDNTLLQPKTDLGSVQWFCHQHQEFVALGLTSAEAAKQILPLFFHINHTIDLIPIESTLVDDITHIKNNCERTLCLTARPLPLAERTLQQLQKNALCFHVPELDEFVFNLNSVSLYKQGCLFCGLNCKGDVLLAFLKAINYHPDVIIFIDDKEANLEAIETAAKQRNIPCVCLRYAGCDERVRNYDKEKTEQELQEFLIKHPIQ